MARSRARWFFEFLVRMVGGKLYRVQDRRERNMDWKPSGISRLILWSDIIGFILSALPILSQIAFNDLTYLKFLQFQNLPTKRPASKQQMSCWQVMCSHLHYEKLINVVNLTNNPVAPILGSWTFLSQVTTRIHSRYTHTVSQEVYDACFQTFFQNSVLHGKVSYLGFI